MGLLSGLFGGGGQAAAGGVGGFLSGLGQKAHDVWNGTTPQLNIQEHPDLMDERLGPIHQMPTFTDTGKTTGGLLSKMQAPDSRGLTFGDKLYAAGNVLQGDSGGAATFLQNQRATADAMDQRMQATRLARSGARNFRNNLNPDGTMNFKGYADAMGDDLDPMAALKLEAASRPHLTPMSTGNGGTASFNEDTGQWTPGIAGQRPAPEGYTRRPDGSLSPIDPNYAAGQRQLYGDRYELQNQYKRFAPKGPGKPGAPQPRATGRVL